MSSFVTVIMALITRSTSQKAFNFSSLPTEVRLMIWNETFEPRILHITHLTRRATPGNWREVPYTHVRFKSREKPPITLQICHESRTLALKHYTPSFHSLTTPFSRASEVKQTALYFSPELDTVHVVDDAITSMLSYPIYTQTTKRIKTLAIAAPRSFSLALYTLSRVLPALERLETYILVTEAEAESAWKHMEDIMIQAQDRLRLEGKCGAWKTPAVKVMNSELFEGHL